MAINVSFNGATLLKPGAYSKTNIDLSGGFALGPVGLIAIFGESTRGRSGAEETDISKNVFRANQITDVRNKYGSGPLVDAMNFLFAPASDGAIPGGAQAVYIYKTNSSVRSSLVLASSFGTVRALEYGIGGNTITYKASATSEVAPSVSSSAPFDASAMGVLSFTIAQNGDAPVTLSTAVTYSNLSAFQAAVAAWTVLVPGVTITASGSSISAVTLTIAMDADSLANQNGFGKSMEIAGAALTAMSLVAGQVVSSVESAMTVTVKQTRDLLQEQDTLGGNIVLKAGYDGVSSSASVEVSASQVILTAGAAVATFDKSAYSTLLQLVNAMNLTVGWKVSLGSTLYNSLPCSVLDEVVVSAKSSDAATIKPARIKKDAQEVADMMANSSIVSIVSQSATGLMDASVEVALAGGTLGATSTASMAAALSAFEQIRVNSVIPLFSRDSTADILDSLTDAGSSYTIAGIHQSVKTHCQLMSTTKNRSERQGYISLKASFASSLDTAALLADARMQLSIQDTKNNDSQGALKWFQPWSSSCLLAGARAGSPVGTPLTFKYMNCSGIRHTAQAMSTPEEDIVIDFNPNAQYDQAIMGGITFMENPQSGGIRIVVDSTTYQKDGNWVYNRGNVLYAADVLAFDFRNQLENIFIGQKNNIQASEIKSVAASILATFLAQGITVSTPEAKNGYKKLDVTISGNVINITAIVVLVEGIDFILSDITITRVQSAA
ncbi:hypothetical protein UFOVP53_214 [uncultured Caudovirales phage]|uniref:Tail sheath protein n=1 Tax=uncultured Caudovirales phage TaxID=2100421 RepID=A0A6J5L0X9_9CAUD|nr:hypothetical protein UFOVP53_214 [uncultured Caudovirales phage]